MIGLFSNIVFLQPWILAGLAVLPVLWLLLRVTPPAPRRIILPTARFLKGLIPENRTATHTPWWILLLRLAVAALVILALAGPVQNPQKTMTGSGPVRLVIDNSWPSAASWQEQQREAERIITQAGREGRALSILTTAPEGSGEKILSTGLIPSSEALGILKGLKPLPWGADYKQAAEEAKKTSAPETVTTLWLGHGLGEGSIEKLAGALRNQGPVFYHAPAADNLPLLLRLEKNTAGGFELSVLGASPGTRQVRIAALARDGSLLDEKIVAVTPDNNHETRVTFDLPAPLRGQVYSFRLGGDSGAGGTVLLGDGAQRRLVGIAGSADKANEKPLLEATYYLRRALEPFAEIIQGPPADLADQKVAVIILPDIAALQPGEMEKIGQWVEAGGLLLRFAGPVMAKSAENNVLVPVPLRAGGRAMDGSLTWQTPAKMRAFPAESPFAGIALHEDVTVRRQILAQPVDDIESKTWAQLEDGTPLITAAPHGRGLLVMVHTTASPDWSDLPLSGSFVEILHRIVAMAANPQAALAKTGQLQPLRALDGFGALRKPDSTAQPINAAAFGETVPGPRHPPGLYGFSGAEQPLNVAAHVSTLRAAGDFNTDINMRGYGPGAERNLMPYLLFAALILFLVDWLIMSAMAAGAVLFACLVLFAFAPVPAEAQESAYANGLYLAYVDTGDANVNALAETGLRNLATVIGQRTSIEPAGVATVNPETDELAFFPLLYWPAGQAQKTLDPKAARNLQSYLDHGGTILFDARNGGNGTDNSQGAQAVRLVSAALNIPALEPVPADHVLGRSYYLLREFPGLYTTGTLWVEGKVDGRDGVSSVIIGTNDWAAAWAGAEGGAPQNYQQEVALRFGVNLVMYALTGNYKSDQVHIPFILERLGQ